MSRDAIRDRSFTLNYTLTQTQVSGAQVTPVEDFDSSELMVMPEQWRRELYQAALEVDADKIVQLIEQIGPTHQALSQKLTELVQNFCFDEILELLHT
ncbi:hypothetical protein NUACC21_46830 [Scytonema sp. NUACC21]